LQEAFVMVMTPRLSKQDENDVAADERPSTQRQRRDDAVDVLSEALWELWLRRHAQAQRQATVWDEEERAHG
jgi:hypothetical protein